MIPKIIHYCWLSGDDYPEKIKYCINSWKKHLPDYELWLWDLNRFDIEKYPWCKNAYNAKKYAFAADFIRFFALYNYGGIYLDSDVEVVKSFNDLLDLPYFIGKEQGCELEPAIFGAEKGWQLLKEMMDYYNSNSFLNDDGSLNIKKTCPDVMYDIANRHMTLNNISSKSEFVYDEKILNVFDADFFSPKFSNNPIVKTTKNTYSIHHFEASWYPASKKLYRWIITYSGETLAKRLSVMVNFFKRIF